MDGRLEILMVRWHGCKIGNTQASVEEAKDETYSSLGERDKRSEILKVRWNG